MSEFSRIVTHYLETIVIRAQLSGFDEMRAEIESAVEADERTRERRFEAIAKHIDHLGQEIDRRQP